MRSFLSCGDFHELTECLPLAQQRVLRVLVEQIGNPRDWSPTLRALLLASAPPNNLKRQHRFDLARMVLDRGAAPTVLVEWVLLRSALRDTSARCDMQYQLTNYFAAANTKHVFSGGNVTYDPPLEERVNEYDYGHPIGHRRSNDPRAERPGYDKETDLMTRGTPGHAMNAAQRKFSAHNNWLFSKDDAYADRVRLHVSGCLSADGHADLARAVYMLTGSALNRALVTSREAPRVIEVAGEHPDVDQRGDRPLSP